MGSSSTSGALVLVGHGNSRRVAETPRSVGSVSRGEGAKERGVRIGVTGHIWETEPAGVRPMVQRILRRLGSGGSFVVVSPLAAIQGNPGIALGDAYGSNITNIGLILGDLGLGYSDIVKTTIFLADVSDFAAVNGVYGGYFTEAPPARSTIEAGALPLPQFKVEIEVIAAR